MLENFPMELLQKFLTDCRWNFWMVLQRKMRSFWTIAWENFCGNSRRNFLKNSWKKIPWELLEEFSSYFLGNFRRNSYGSPECISRRIRKKCWIIILILIRKTIQNHAEGNGFDSRLIHELPAKKISLFPFCIQHLCVCHTMYTWKNNHWLRKLTS